MPWIDGYGKYRAIKNDNKFEILRPALYSVGTDNEGIFVQTFAEKFELNHKIYSLKDYELKLLINAFEKLPNSKNLGILLNGIKGTGKSVMAKMVCNMLVEKGVPVFIIDAYGYETFINENVSQDCVIFIDEYEKIYNVGGSDNPQVKLLSIMDGSKSSDKKRMFLLTSNVPKLEDNMINRPSRIRYNITFSSLMRNEVEDIVDDLLINKEFREDIIKNILLMNIITIDLVKSIVEECNLQELPFSKFAHIFNAERSVLYKQLHLIYTIDGVVEEILPKMDNKNARNNDDFYCHLTIKQIFRLTSREFINKYLDELNTTKVKANTSIGFGSGAKDLFDSANHDDSVVVTLKCMQMLPDNKQSFLLCLEGGKGQYIEYDKPVIGYVEDVYKNAKYIDNFMM